MKHSVCLLEAVNLALASEMRRDEEIVLLGEDIGVNGGVFRATANLRDEFGLKRVMDTPLAESMIAGLSIGMASQGLKPVAEIQFMGFIFPALEQIICHAARMRNRTRGRLTCPMVIRAPFGGGIHAPEHHSESTEALLAHIPGLKVVIPSSPARAYGLLLAAIRDPDPVLFLEPKRIYRSQQQEILDNGEALPLGSCFTLREGSDITLISWGAMITETLAAAEHFQNKGVNCEVIDVASISPLDMTTILASVKKTGRVVIVHEAPRNAGIGAEIAATIAERALLDLQAPIARVTGYDTVMPYFRLENHYLPNTQDIIDSINETLEFA
ncbi:alpha-ketoacid dehydrogenase subunit beta [Neptuniibacter sp. SY11_33]|uniref:alpha-ketoacid dehydrogenase subunit beta n=1 Tax=Neptuniibacter sp. SY11_33 TaxID=3398215 RepID=UPI0039F5B50B